MSRAARAAFRKTTTSILFLLLLLCGARLPAQQEKTRPADSGTPGSRDAIIGPNDAVSISAQDADELSKTWRVGPDGNLNLPFVGEIAVSGMTASQLEQELIVRLSKFIKQPQVFVSVSQLRSQPVTVIGSVGQPGSLQLEGHKSLLDILVATGGPKEAGPTVTLTRRKEYGAIPLPQARDEEGGKYSVADINLQEVMEGRSDAANLTIQPYDVISVTPQAKQQRLVHIIGEVTKPGAVELVQQQSVSIMQVLAAAGGVTRMAALHKTVIMHINPDGLRTEIAAIDLKKIIEGKVKDLSLVSGDVVVVPSSQLKTYLDITTKSMVAGSTMVLTRF